MADRVAQNPVTGAWDDQVPNRALWVSGKLDFTSAVIGGDTTLVFHPTEGPHLDFQHAEIAGRLTIAPARATYITLHKLYNDDNTAANDKRKRTRRAAGSREFYRLTREFPEIDLRQAYARVISHPPSAWPQQHGLLIAGFRYDGFRGIGPLVSDETLLGGRQRMSLRRSLAIVGAVFLALVLPGEWVAFTLLGDLGVQVNVGLGVFVAGLVASSELLRRLRKKAPAMGLEWLARQRFERHPTRSIVSQPLEPYVRAAKVLRAAGEHRVANRVELERLRLRERMRGWDTAPVTKLFLLAVDLISKYGHAPGRTGAWIAATIILAAGTFEYANKLGLMQVDRDAGGRPAFVSLVYAADLVIPFIGLAHEELWRPALPCTREELARFEMKESARRTNAETASPREASSASKAAATPPNTDETFTPTCYATRDAPRKVQILVYIEWVFRVFGLFLSSVIATAVAARAETVLARIED